MDPNNYLVLGISSGTTIRQHDFVAKPDGNYGYTEAEALAKFKELDRLGQMPVAVRYRDVVGLVRMLQSQEGDQSS
ncbi:MAG: hypothetical protein PHF67_00495 [Candidatus Nanoarchaeia archaeon]|nr:hypothetical protein [Candidatus Nanoarchaeia archaeon]